MALVTFSESQRSSLQNILDAGDEARYQAFLKACDLHTCYASDMGRLMLAAETEAGFSHLPKASRTESDRLFQICKQKEDMRCQVGQVLSNLKSRSETSAWLSHSYHAFRRNAKATVQIVDKSGLEIEGPDKDGKISIRGIECRDGLNLSIFARNNAHQSMPLCDEYFYANELIPKTRIYGSGFFIDHDKLVTAAHVLNEAFAAKAKPENLLFIRGRYVYETGTPKITLNEDQLYRLDQPKILIRDQIRNGGPESDMAWVKVRPYFKDKPYPFEWNGFFPEPVKKEAAVYALGHGLGVPMKLSFEGKIEDETYANTSAMFTCDLNILPGSSGAPIFDANSHQLVGVISGLHEIYTEPVPRGNCVNLKINMEGKLSGVATHIAPFRSL